jgi:hypothetical protein
MLRISINKKDTLTPLSQSACQAVREGGFPNPAFLVQKGCDHLGSNFQKKIIVKL